MTKDKISFLLIGILMCHLQLSIFGNEAVTAQNIQRLQNRLNLHNDPFAEALMFTTGIVAIPLGITVVVRGGILFVSPDNSSNATWEIVKWYNSLVRLAGGAVAVVFGLGLIGYGIDSISIASDAWMMTDNESAQLKRNIDQFWRLENSVESASPNILIDNKKMIRMDFK